MLSLISVHLCPVLPVEQAMFPARNAIDAHAQDFMVNDDCYYSSYWNLHSTLAHYTLPEMDYVLSLCSSKRVCSYQKQSSSPPNRATLPSAQKESCQGLWSVDGLITYFIATSPLSFQTVSSQSRKVLLASFSRP
jgi:hypothetical protein